MTKTDTVPSRTGLVRELSCVADQHPDFDSANEHSNHPGLHSQFHPQAFMPQLPSLAETGSPYFKVPVTKTDTVPSRTGLVRELSCVADQHPDFDSATNIHQSSWFALSISSTSFHATNAIPRRNRITLYSRFL